MFIQVNQHTIHYVRYGNGPELLCCLPGYGETGTEFEALAGILHRQFTVICPDLPLHGQSSWLSDKFDPDDLYLVLRELSRQEGFGEKTMALAGYSMGGRLALAYAEKFPQTLNRLILIAPDGLHQNFWYWLSTQTKTGNRLFYATMQHPGWLFRGMKWGRKLKLLNQSIVKFSHRYLDDPMQRKNLYERWTLFRKFRPNIGAVKVLINRQPLPALLVFGKYDRIIPPALSKKLIAKNTPQMKIVVLEAGHRLLRPQFAATIASAISSLTVT
ncbi:alpha/beta fold hydrolase [Flavihumibacter fluvii]|uniref:alpha/beta fold hydrolase n=1 Tax=Flavihumibacter fluvii TaxID=2838157 RepID=UPI001BDEE5C5|nr:alpha/beta hydrolase [Flavihumibacter fluvii]ULQ51568.1 alpha/beta hydrolase [Flavihumibacter fluvii]